jgi:hypothetical protein
MPTALHGHVFWTTKDRRLFEVERAKVRVVNRRGVDEERMPTFCFLSDQAFRGFHLL